MRRTHLFIPVLIGALVLMAGKPCRAGTATFSLGTPVVTAGEADIGISLLFSGNPGDTIEAIQLSVLGSDPLLTANGTDFSRFAFDLNATTLPGWLANPTIDAVGLAFLFPSDPISGPFLSPSATPYDLGTLKLNLDGLPTGQTLFVTIEDGPAGSQTDAGGTVNGNFIPSFRDGAPDASVQFDVGSARFTTSAVPGPLSLLTLGQGVLGVLAIYLCVQSTSCPAKGASR
jgi:hypothetical protein